VLDTVPPIKTDYFVVVISIFLPIVIVEITKYFIRCRNVLQT
jgi:hypothetical protein